MSSVICYMYALKMMSYVIPFLTTWRRFDEFLVLSFASTAKISLLVLVFYGNWIYTVFYKVYNFLILFFFRPSCKVWPGIYVTWFDWLLIKLLQTFLYPPVYVSSVYNLPTTAFGSFSKENQRNYFRKWCSLHHSVSTLTLRTARLILTNANAVWTKAIKRQMK